MCLIIYHKDGVRVDDQRLYEAYTTNPDGFGILYRWKGEVCHQKGLYNFREAHAVYQNALRHHVKSVALHFRTASSGPVHTDYCHPYAVSGDLMFMQNGNLAGFEDARAGLNDVGRFNEEVLKRLPKNFLTDGDVRDALERYCAVNRSKMLFMTASGGVHIVNEGSGVWIDNVWYSNGGLDNYLGYGYSGAYYYSDGEVRHPGGFLTPRLFGEARARGWDRCEWCRGYFKNLSRALLCVNCDAQHDLETYLQ